jgi:hypothetical protein
VELKTVSRPVRRADLVRLLAYGALYASQQPERIRRPEDLVLVLVAPSPSPALREELEVLGAAMGASERGYARLAGLTYPAWAVFLDEVAVAERDELLGIFGHLPPSGGQAAARWLREHVWRRDATMDNARLEELEGFDDVMLKMLQSLPVDLRLRGLTPEQRLAGLGPEELRRLVEDLQRTLGGG